LGPLLPPSAARVGPGGGSAAGAMMPADLPPSPAGVGRSRSFRPSLPKIESDAALQTALIALGDSEFPRSLSPPISPPDQSACSSCPGTPPMRPTRFASMETVTCSVATSGWQFAEPTQTLIFLDWDDTLFPCTELFERWCLPRRQPPFGVEETFPEALERDLAKWRTAVHEYLSIVCALSDRCVIVTNSTSPWVEACVSRFAPSLLPFFVGGGPQQVRVVYAGDLLRRAKIRAATNGSNRVPFGIACCCACGPARWRETVMESLRPIPTLRERRTQLTQAKLSSMRQEAVLFYSRYPGQTWKNIISLGDMKYERDAVQELSSSRMAAPLAPARERLRTKALVLPSAPTLNELTLWLRFFRLLLPTLVRFDGDVDLDLCKAQEPLQLLAKAFEVPALGSVHFPQLRPHAYPPVPDAPGMYRVLYPAPVGRRAVVDDLPLCHVEAGAFVEVVEVSVSLEFRCVRGRLAHPAGWITLVNQENGCRWAEKEDDHTVEEALDEVAFAVQDATFERTNSLGAHPWHRSGIPRSPAVAPAG